MQINLSHQTANKDLIPKRMKEESTILIGESVNTDDSLPIVRYKVAIIETLRKEVIIELPLGSATEVKEKVRDMYHDEEIVLTADDFYSMEIDFLGRE